MASNCVFCDIVAKLVPARIVREWSDAIAIRPRSADENYHHYLVIPKLHVPDALTDPDVTVATMRRALELATPPCNLVTSIGAEAEQTVFHLHLHVAPRAFGDGFQLPWPASKHGPAERNGLPRSDQS